MLEPSSVSNVLQLEHLTENYWNNELQLLNFGSSKSQRFNRKRLLTQTNIDNSNRSWKKRKFKSTGFNSGNYLKRIRPSGDFRRRCSRSMTRTEIRRQNVGHSNHRCFIDIFNRVRTFESICRRNERSNFNANEEVVPHVVHPIPKHPITNNNANNISIPALHPNTTITAVSHRNSSASLVASNSSTNTSRTPTQTLQNDTYSTGANESQQYHSPPHNQHSNQPIPIATSISRPINYITSSSSQPSNLLAAPLQRITQTQFHPHYQYQLNALTHPHHSLFCHPPHFSAPLPPPPPPPPPLPPPPSQSGIMTTEVQFNHPNACICNSNHPHHHHHLSTFYTPNPATQYHPTITLATVSTTSTPIDNTLQSVSNVFTRYQHPTVANNPQARHNHQSANPIPLQIHRSNLHHHHHSQPHHAHHHPHSYNDVTGQFIQNNSSMGQVLHQDIAHQLAANVGIQLVMIAPTSACSITSTPSSASPPSSSSSSVSIASSVNNDVISAASLATTAALAAATAATAAAVHYTALFNAVTAAAVTSSNTQSANHNTFNTLDQHILEQSYRVALNQQYNLSHFQLSHPLINHHSHPHHLHHHHHPHLHPFSAHLPIPHPNFNVTSQPPPNHPATNQNPNNNNNNLPKTGISRYDLDTIPLRRFSKSQNNSILLHNNTNINSNSDQTKHDKVDLESENDGDEDEDDEEDDDKERCMICLENFVTDELIRMLHCSHDFHSHCVDKWLKINRTCPLCRSDVSVIPIRNK